MSSLQDWLPADGKGKDAPRVGPPPPPPRPPAPTRRRFPVWYFVLLTAALALFNLFGPRPGAHFIDFDAFKAKVREGQIKRVQFAPDALFGFTTRFEDTAAAPKKGLGLPSRAADTTTIFRTAPLPQAEEGLVKLLDSVGAQYYAPAQGAGTGIRNFLFTWVLPAVFFMGLWMFILPRLGGGGGGAGLFALGKSRAHIVAEGEVGVTFEDVAGVDEAKEELKEIIDFLKLPGKYLAIGGKVPKGVLLIGPPGTGKTLLAKAVAGEAKVPFFRISGSDFVEMIVGVGAARVRDLFKQAREKAPCIVFIDELDAIGKSRSNMLGGHDEREQTLNQLLVEMDGFDPRAGVIVLGATNRPEILDSALLRPGRFDRHVVVDKPDLAGREAILRRHARNVKMDEGVALATLARKTPGFVGADLANIINEGALLAVKAGRERVSQPDLEEAVEKVMAGLKKKNRVMQPKEKERVAYHETGHALVATFTPGSDPVEKVSIIPRGLGALGFTWQLPTEERYLMTETEILARIDVLLGGRAAEEVVFGEASTGAANDLGRATELARQMIMDHGMNDRFRNVVLRNGRPAATTLTEAMGPREISESTQQYVDEKIAAVMRDRYTQVTSLLLRERAHLDAVARRLLEKETLSEKEFKELLAPTAVPARLG